MFLYAVKGYDQNGNKATYFFQHSKQYNQTEFDQLMKGVKFGMGQDSKKLSAISAKMCNTLGFTQVPFFSL